MSVSLFPRPSTGPAVTNLSPGGRRMAIGNASGLITVIDAITQDLVFVASGHDGPVRVLSWSQDATLLASGGQDGVVRVWDVARGCSVCKFKGHSGAVSSLAWSPNGVHLASGSGLEIRRWNVEQELKQPA